MDQKPDQKSRVDRREFLQATAVAGLVAGASSSVQAQTSPDPSVLNQPAGAPLRTRRVVTGHRADGQSFVAIDEIADKVSSGREGMQASVIWSTGESPADNMITQDGAARELATSDDNGTVFRIVKYDPGVAPRIEDPGLLDPRGVSPHYGPAGALTVRVYP